MPITIGDPVTLSGARKQATDIRDRAIDQAVGLVRQSETLPDLYRDAVEESLLPPPGRGASPSEGGRITLGEPVTITTRQQNPSFTERYFTAPFGRGIDRFQALASLAIGDYEEFANQQREIAAGIQLTPEDQDIMQRISETDSTWEAVQLYATNPRLIAAISAESLGLFSPTLGAAAAGAAVGAGALLPAAIVGLGSGATEYLATIEQAAVEQGVDPTDAGQMERLMQDEQFLAEARQRGIQRGIPIAALDALSVGLAGKLFTASRGASRTARSLAATGELGAQGTYGATGEVLAQLAEYGRIYAPGEAVSEFVGELGTGPVEIGIAALSRRDRTGAPPPAAEPPPITQQPVPPDVVEALRRTETTEPEQQVLPLSSEIPPAELPPGQTQDMFTPRTIPAEPVPELTDEEVQQRLAETAEAEEGAVPVEPEPPSNVIPFEPTPLAEPQTTVARLNRWMGAQEREETTTKAGRKISRQKKLFTEEGTQTKVTPTSLVKAALLSIGESMRKQKIAKAKDLAPFTTRDSSSNKIAAYYDSLISALEQNGRQEVADSLRTVFDVTDPWETFARLQAVEGIISGGKGVAVENIGTIYEPVINQYRRARVEADKIYKEGVKPPRVKDRIQAVQSMFSAVVRLFEQRSGTKITRGSDEALVARTLPVKEVAKRLEKQAPYLQEAGAQLATLYGRMFGAKDATAQAVRSVYNELDTIGNNLARRGGKRQAARDEAVQEVGKKRAAEQPVVEVTPTQPAPQERKRSERVPKSRIDKLLEDRELLREKKVRDFAATQGFKTGENQVAAAARAGKEQPKEITEASPKKPKSRKKRSQKAQPRQTVQQNLTTPAGRVAEQKKISSRPEPKGFKEATAPLTAKEIEGRQKARQARQAEKEAAAERRTAEQLRKPVIKPRKVASVAKLLKDLRINKQRGAALLSDLPFFRGMLTGTASEISPEARLAVNFRTKLPAALRKQFDSLIDAFVNAERGTEEVPVISRGIVYPSRTREIGYQPAGAEPVPAQLLQAEISAFVEQHARNANEVKPAVLNYAQSLRTLQQRGFEQGTIILEGPIAVSTYNEVLQAHSADFLTAINRPLRESIVNPEPTQLGTMNQLVTQWLSQIPEQATWLRDILTQLQATGVDIPVLLSPELANENGPIGGRYAHTDQGRFIVVNPTGTDGQTLRTLLHEMVHASTSYGYDTSARYRRAVDRLYDEAAKHARRLGVDFYGLKNGKEFLAEGFTNVEFQQFLKDIGPRELSVWQRFVNAVREFFGMDAKYFNVFDTLISQQDQLFLQESDIVSPTGVTDEFGGGDGGGNITFAAKKWSGVAKDLAQKGNLGFMDLNVMERKYRKLISDAAATLNIEGNPLTRIAEAITRTSRQARELAQQFQLVADKVQALELQQRTALGAAMELVTRAQLDPTQSISSTNQPWLYDKKGQLRNRELTAQARAAYDSLPAATQDVLNELRELTMKARGLRRAALLKHALKSTFPNIDGTDLTALSNAPTTQEFASRVATSPPLVEGVPIDPAALNSLAESVFASGEIPGTYFPLRRNGEYVTSIDADEVEEVYFAMHATRAEAEADAARLRAEGKGEANVSKVIRGENDAAASNAVQLLVSKLDPSKAETDAIRGMLNTAMAEVLADRILYASQLKRQGVEGAKPSDMLKNVEDYIRSSISTTSTLDTAHDYRRGLRELADIQKEADASPSVKDTAGNIRNELLIRASEVASDRNVMVTDRVLGSLGFFTYLGAPSYWILNSTQTAVVGVPVLAGLSNTGFMQATRAMTRAYRTLQRATKGQGTAALTGNLEETKLKLTPEQQQVITRLEEDNVIQATIAHEFNVLTKAGSGVYSKVTNVLTGVPEAIERFNRISMALAAMDLGVTDYTQIKDIVEASQFNYDPANRARLLKYAPEFLGGGARRFIAPMMMFKVFGVNMARLVYGNLFDAMFKKGMSAADRAASLKIVAGLVGSHTLVGGMFGGLGLGMNQVIMAAINGLLDDEDEIDPATAIDEFLTEHTSEYIARLVTRGLPAAVGVDMSASVNLGNLLFMPRDTDWSEYGGVEQSVYGLLGPVAQYFAGSARETSRFIDGEAGVADVLEKSVPLKLYRALSQTWRYGMEGLETRQGQQFLSPDDLNVGNLLTTSLGLRAAPVAQRQQQFYAQRTFNRTLENKKSELMAEAATAVNAAQRRRARKNIREWNAKQRERRNYGLIIRQSSIRQSRETRRTVAAEYGRGEFTQYNR